MNKKILIILIAIVVIIIAIFGNNLFKKKEISPVSLTKVSFVLDYLPWSAQAGFWVAKEKGYFSKEGLDVTLNIPSDPSTVLQTVSSGRDDFGISYLPDVLVARSQNIPVVSIMALVQHPLYVLVVLKESGIEEPKDLIGKKVGHSGLAFNESVISTMLKNQEESIKDIELVNVGFESVPALIGEKVDAILAYESYEVISVNNQGFHVNVMEAEKYGVPDYYELALVTNEEKIAKNPDVVQRFVRATKRGYEDAISDPETAVKVMKKLNSEADLTLEIPSVKLIAPLWVPVNKIFGWQEEERWVDFGNWMKENDLISKDLDVKAAFDNSFVENAAKE